MVYLDGIYPFGRAAAYVSCGVLAIRATRPRVQGTGRVDSISGMPAFGYARYVMDPAQSRDVMSEVRVQNLRLRLSGLVAVHLFQRHPRQMHADHHCKTNGTEAVHERG